MKSRLITLAFAALAAPAFATTTASISAGNFAAVVKDLNTADGVTSGITWDSSWFLSGSAGVSSQTGYELVTYSWGQSLEARYGTQQSFWDYAAAPDASLVRSGLAGGAASFSISLDADGKPTAAAQMSVGEGTDAYVSAQMSRGFWLTAGTQVTFSILADSAVAGTAYTGSWTQPVGIGVPAHSRASANLGFGVSSQGANLSLSGGNDFIYSTSAYEGLGEADQLKLIVRNTSTTDQYYSLNFYAQVSAQEHLDPATAALVPEPESYALMALGLLGVGAAVRRRKAA